MYRKITKICYVIVNCKKTGPMNQTLNIIKNLDLNQYEVSIITLLDEEPDNSMIDAYKAVCNQCICLHMSKFLSILCGKRLVTAALDKVKPDIIHGLGMPPYRMTLNYKKAKHLVTLRNYLYEDYPSHYNKYVGPILAMLDMHLIRKLAKQGEYFVTCSESLTNIYRNRENIDIPYIRNGVDVSKYPLKASNERMLLRKKLGLPENKIIFIYTGGMIDRKDQESAIRGILNSDCKEKVCLILCGIGANLGALKKKYISEYNIIFTGKVDNVSEYLKAADIYLSTSKSEGLPNGVLEAMASGTCVLLSDIPQHMEIMSIDNGIGLTYQLGNMKDLKTKIEKMVSMDLVKMGKRSNIVVKNNFTAKMMSQNYQTVYKRLMASVKH